MTDILDFKGLSDSAMIGKALILASIVLAVVDILMYVLIAFLGSVGLHCMGFSSIFHESGVPEIWMEAWGLIAAIIIALDIAGLIVLIMALRMTCNRDFRNAGILALIASVLPPIRILALIGGILCLVSPEARNALSPPEPGTGSDNPNTQS